DAETGADTDKTNNEGDTEILQIGEEQGQAGSDPGKTPESRPPPDDDKMDKDQARPDPGESRVALDPQISSETLSLMKNLNDAYIIGDQFLNDKSTEDEPRTLNVEVEVVSMSRRARILITRLRILDPGDLPEADMKEMLHQRMFESGSYKSHPEHVALYEALEVFIERAQRDELLAKKNKPKKDDMMIKILLLHPQRLRLKQKEKT
ncbi:hypothetical protein Tco_0030605, partial [Tanacetum coccineum]